MSERQRPDSETPPSDAPPTTPPDSGGEEAAADAATSTASSAGEDGGDASASQPPRRRRRRRWVRRLGVTVVVLLGLYTLAGFFGVPYVITEMVPPRVSERLTGELAIGEATFNPFTLTVTVGDVTVTDADGRSVVLFERFEGHFNLVDSIADHGWHVHHARLYGPEVDIERAEDGTLNLAGLVRPSSKPSGEPMRRIPRVVVSDLLVEDAAARFTDRSVEPPVERSVSDVAFSVDVFDSAPTHANEHGFTATIGDAASIDWSGTTFIDPLTTRGSLAIDGVELAPFAPYLGRFADIAVEDGRLSVQLDYTLDPVGGTGERLSVTGAAIAVDGLRATTGGQPLLAMRRVEVDGVTATLAGRDVRVERVLVDGIEASVRRRADGQLQLMTVLPGRAQASPDGSASPAPRTAADGSTRVDPVTIEYPLERLTAALQQLLEDITAEWSVTVSDVSLTGGSIDVEDAAAQEPVSLAVRDLALTAGPSRSTEGFRTPFELSMTPPGGGTVTLAGDLEPMQRQATVDVTVADLGLQPYRAYLPPQLPAPFEGTRLEGAALSMDGRFEGAAGDDGLRGTWEGRLTVRDLVTSRERTAAPVLLTELDTDGRLVLTAASDGTPNDATWSGRVSLAGLAADLVLMDRSQSLRLEQARTTGDLTLAFADAGPAVQWTGDLRTGGITASGGGAGGDVGGDGSLELRDLNLAGATVDWSAGDRSLRAESLALGRPRIQATLQAAGDSAAVAAAQGGDAERAAADDSAGTSAADPGVVPVTVTLPIALRLGRLTIEDGGFAIEDRRTDTPLALAGEGLSLEASAIDSAGGTPIDLTLESGVADVGRVTVRGGVDPFRAPLFADLDVGVEGMPLRPFSPAATPVLGYAIDSGRLTLSLPIRVEDGRLDGSVSARLDNFHLGERVRSETATDLPLKMGLALLRDADDSISADFGIKGDITAPGFSLGDAIIDAAFSTIGNVATAPFKLLAGLLEGDEDVDLSEVRFEPGGARLVEGGSRDLDLLARALKKRPALGLAIAGLTGGGDEAALRQQQLDEMIARRRAGGAADEERALAAVFAERFPEAVRTPVPIPPGRLDQIRIDPKDMRERLLEDITVDAASLAELAAERAERVRTVLVEQNGIDQSRLRVRDPQEAAADEDLEAGPRVAFELFSRQD